MAWRKNYGTGSSDDDDGSSIKFDLRIVRAKLIGSHLDDIYTSQLNKNYMDWFRNLNLLHSAVHHLVDRAVEEYDDLKQEAIRVINRNSDVYLGKSSDPKGITEIEEALLEIGRYLLHAMETNGVFGRQEDVTGL